MRYELSSSFFILMAIRYTSMKNNILKTVIFLFLIFLFAGCKKGYKEYSYEYKPENSIDYKVEPIDQGINLENWFNDQASPEEYGTRFSKSYLAAIKSMGFKSVRIPIGRTVLFNESNPSVLNPTNLPFVDSAISQAIQAGLTVQLDVMHQTLENYIGQKLVADPVFYKKFPLYYEAIASYFKKYPASHLYFELYNEPVFRPTADPFNLAYYWDPIQQLLINAVRKETKEHAIIATGMYTSFAGLQRMKLYDDPRIVYNVHFYEPLLFTHQGASWIGWDYIINARNIPYPSTPQNMQPFVDAVPVTDQNSKYYLSQYGLQYFNANKMDELVREIAAWAYHKHIRIVCNEFGVYKSYANPQNRINYITDLRKAFEKYHISWTMWELDGPFGLVEYPDGDLTNLIVDQQMLEALGLQ